MLSWQKLCTNPFTASIKFMLEHGNLPMKDQQTIYPVSICSLLKEYMGIVYTFKLIILDVGLKKWRALVFVFMISCENTRWATLWCFKQVFLPILRKESSKILTIWELGSKLFIIFILKFLLTTAIDLDFNNDKNNLHLSPSHLE